MDYIDLFIPFYLYILLLSQKENLQQLQRRLVYFLSIIPAIVKGPQDHK